MESIGGSLSLESKGLGYGTTVTLKIPCCASPQWFPTKPLSIKKHAPVVVLDDSNAIQDFWKSKLTKTGATHFHFLSSEELLNWYQAPAHTMLRSRTTFIVDYELRSDDPYNGLQLIEMLGIKQNGYLVTSYAEHTALQEQASSLGIWLVPKSVMDILLMA